MNNKIKVGIELQNEARKWAEISKVEIANNKTQTLHEVINKCRLFLDCDSSKNETKNLLTLFNYVGEYMYKYLVKCYFQFEDDESIYFNIYHAKCTETERNHFYLDFFACGPCGWTEILFDSAKAQLKFWQKFIKSLKKHFEGDYSFIDLAVYRENSQLRTIYSPKYGEKRFYKPCKSIAGVYDQDKTTIYNGFCFKNNKEEFINEEMNINSLVKNIHSKKFEIKKFNFKFDINDFLAGVRYENPDYYNTLYFKIDYKEESKELINQEPIFPTQYEILIFEQILKKGKINVDRRADWIKAHHRIFCFYHYLSPEERNKKIVEFFASKGWDKQIDKSENIELAETIKNHINYSLKNNEEFFIYEPFENIINVDEINYIDLKAGESLIIKSGCNTKKTVNFLKKYQDKNILIISYRITLTANIIETAGKMGLNFVSYLDSPEECPKHFICQLDSLFKYAKWMEAFDIIFMDECEELFNHFNFANTNRREVHTLITMFNFFFKEKSVIAVSANVDFKTFEAFDNFGPQKIYSYKNIKKDKKEYSACIYNDYTFLENKLKTFVNRGSKVAVACNRKDKIANKLESILLSEGHKVLNITADKNKDVKLDEWKNYNVIIYTPTIEAGVSYVEEHFDYIFGFFENHSNNYLACYQMLFRVRYPKVKKMHLYIKGGIALKSADTYCMDKIIDNLDKENQLNNLSRKDIIKFNDSLFSAKIYKYNDTLTKILVLNEFFKTYSDCNFRRAFIEELKYSGFQISYNTKVLTKKVEQEQKERNDLDKNTKDFLLGQPDYDTTIKMQMARIPLNEKTIDIFTKHRGKESIDNFIKTFCRYTIMLKKNTDESKILVLQELIEQFKTPQKPEKALDIIDNYYKNKFDTLHTLFNPRRKYSFEDFKIKEPKYKTQIINSKLEYVFLKLHKVKNVYILEPINKQLVKDIEEYFKEEQEQEQKKTCDYINDM